ncbi:MAG: hypothetical protein WKG32_03600 [Gemmatimonadaceae bacterium]
MASHSVDGAGRTGERATPAGGATRATLGQPPVEVRACRTHADYAACVALQEATWGASFSERVPAAILKVAQRIGGVTAGAFAPDGRLLGFVFGMTGVEHGQLVHWSDMLAVHEDARNLGIGRHLKEFQRDTLLRLGVSVIYWTFDPLVARNAHFNFNRLGVRAVEYARDMYGAETDSALHRGVGTDRLVVAWRIAGHEAGAAPDTALADPSARIPGAREAPVVNDGGAGAAGGPGDAGAPADRAPVVRIEVPLDILAIQRESLERAAAWRASTRQAFLRSFDLGYEVGGFYRDAATDAGFYILTRPSEPAATREPAPR